MSTELRSFLALTYEELEDLNLKAKEQRKNRVAMDAIQEDRLKYLTEEKRIKAVTVLFSDLEGRLHMLDYDKKFLIKSWDNLTFDGSSIRGFTAQRESDLRLGIDWGAFYWAPPDVFVSGNALVFGEVIAKDGAPYNSDIRGRSKGYAARLSSASGSDREHGMTHCGDGKGEVKPSKMGWAFLERILAHGTDRGLLLDARGNGYRRADPHVEAANHIKASLVDRGSMIRIPIRNEK